MKKLLILLLTVGCIDATAQVEGQDAQGNVSDLAFGNPFRSFDNRFKGIEGYPTLFKFYALGEVTLISGKKVSYDSVNLDIYSSDLLVKREKNESVFNRKLVKQFTLDTDESLLTFVKLKNAEGNDVYYQLLAGTKLKLLKHHYKTVSGPTHSGAYSNGRTYSIFVQGSKVYVQKGEDALVELKSKKTLVALYPDQEEAISAFMKQNRLGVRNEDEAARVIEYINTL